jgi:hypothetical protein
MRLGPEFYTDDSDAANSGGQFRVTASTGTGPVLEAWRKFQ